MTVSFYYDMKVCMSSSHESMSLCEQMHTLMARVQPGPHSVTSVGTSFDRQWETWLRRSRQPAIVCTERVKKRRQAKFLWGTFGT